MAMEKEFIQVNDSELEAVAGGLTSTQQGALFRCTNDKAATKYLQSLGIQPGTATYDEYMHKWKVFRHY